MIKVILRYFIYDNALNILFNKLYNNFTTSKVIHIGQNIKQLVTKKGNGLYVYYNVEVINLTNDYIIFKLHETPVTQRFNIKSNVMLPICDIVDIGT